VEKAAIGTGLRRRALSIGAALLLYCLLAALAFAPVVPWSSSQIFGCACYDTPQQIWFMSWVPHLLTSGGNPFYTTYINAPAGANMMVNTSMMFLSAILAPITFLLGPVASLNVGMRLALVASGMAAFGVLRKWHVRWPIAFVGGLMYAFSPYMIGQANGHLQMAFVAVPPLWLFGWERLLSRRWSARRAGLYLGLLAVVQFFIAVDVLASLLVMTASGLALLAVVYRQQAMRRWDDILRAVAYAAVVAVPLLAVPAYYLLAGPGALPGPQQPVTILDGLRADALSVVVPTALQRFGPASWIGLGSGFGGGNLSENGEYLGIPLVLLLLALVVWQRRSRIVVGMAGAGAVAFVLSLGPRLMFDGHNTMVPLPFEVLSHLPLLRDQIPFRYSLYIQLAASMLLAVGVDAGMTEVRRRYPMGRRWWAGAAAAGVICLVALVPLWPVLPYRSENTAVPSFFTGDGAQHIPAGSNVLTYPYPAFPYDQAMLWQATTNLRFRLVGGYIYTATPTGGTLIPPTLSPATVQAVLSDAMWGSGDKGLPSGTSLSSVATDLRTFLHRYSVSAVIVDEFGAYPDTVSQVVTVATGHEPQQVGGVLFWSTASG
jgi:hypothetical protein